MSNNIEVLESRKVDEEIIKELKDSFDKLVRDISDVYKLDDI